MKNILTHILGYGALFATPFISHGQGGPIWKNNVCKGDECGFANFISLLQDAISFLIVLAIPISAIVFAYGGFEIMTSGDNAGKRTKAKRMMMKVAIGLVVMLAAGLIVNTILSGLGVGDEYKLIETTP